MRISLKSLSIVLIFTIIFSLAVGCSKQGNNSIKDKQTQSQTNNSTRNENNKETSNSNETGFPIINEKITLKMMGAKYSTHGSWDEMYLFKKMEELTNIHFDITTVPEDAWNEKKNIIFASGDLPDVFFKGKLSSKDESLYGEQGVLISLNDLIDKYAPNIKKLMDDIPEVRMRMTQLNGEIYSLAQFSPWSPLTEMLPAGAMWYNKAWADKLGIKQLDTVDDFYEMLKAFKEQDPNGNGKADEIPLSIMSMNELRGLLGAFGLTMNYDLHDDNGKVIYTPIQQGYKDFLKFMNKLWKEGLMDQESFVLKGPQLTAKASEGILGCFGYFAHYGAVGTEKYEEYEHIPALRVAGGEKMYPGYYEISTGTFAITNKNKYPEATIRWVDYLYSDEGAILALYGEEGEHWKWRDANRTSWEYVVPEGETEASYKAKVVTPFAGGGLPFRLNQDFEGKKYQEIPFEYDRWLSIAENVGDYLQPMFPFVKFDVEDQKELNTIKADIDPYVNEMRLKFIMGELDIEKDWDNYVKQLKDMKVDRYVELFQKAYNDQVGK